MDKTKDDTVNNIYDVITPSVLLMHSYSASTGDSLPCCDPDQVFSWSAALFDLLDQDSSACALPCHSLPEPLPNYCAHVPQKDNLSPWCARHKIPTLSRSLNPPR